MPACDLQHLDLELIESKEPNKITQTPYTEPIEVAIRFFDEVTESSFAKKGTQDYCDSVAKGFVLPRHLDSMNKLTRD